MTRLEVQLRCHSLRAANVERDAAASVEESGYVPTGRAVEVLSRIAAALDHGQRGRAWSLTGPYGAGKSSFALFLHALLGHEADPTRQAAQAALARTDSPLADAWTAGRARTGAGPEGFVRCCVTAQREPVTATVLRALQVGAAARWQEKLPKAVRHALRQADRDRTPRSLLVAFDALADEAPVLLLIDEFGKNLEHLAEEPDGADLFVLQELAERCTNGTRPGFLLTLQHLAFDDYLRTAGTVQRREWGKIQGRFEDVPFLEAPEQTVALIADTIRTDHAGPAFQEAKDAWTTRQVQAAAETGVLELLPGGAATIAACYPLHPLTVLALPELCARFGQHGRTLFAFLTGREPHGVVEFLDTTDTETHLDTEISAPGLTSLGLDRTFAFFVNAGGGAAGHHQPRLLEIATTVQEQTGLTADERRLLTTVGLLNLLSQGGPFRASVPVLAWALADDPADQAGVTTHLVAGLERRGLLTYRGFADEWRVWRGSDLDLRRLLEQAREQVEQWPSAQLLAGAVDAPKVIAGRHTQRVGMLRYFDTVFADPHSPAIDRPGTLDAADGLVVHWLGDPSGAEDSLQVNDGPKPVVVMTNPDWAQVVEAARDLAALQQVLARADVAADPVARRELQEGVADARRRLAERTSTRSPERSAPSVRLWPSGTGRPVGRSLSPVLSTVCDEVYSSSPTVRNEMLGRRELTSQAAKARRELLEAMVRHGDQDRLGLEGFGPEVAMYEALLRHTGIHRQVDGVWGFHAPRGDFAAAWGAMRQLVDGAVDVPCPLDRLVEVLLAPPFGLKDGLVPVLLAALLLNRADDVALYQDGTYQQSLTPELLERLVKAPDRFAVRCFETSPQTGRVFTAVAAATATATGRPDAPLRPLPGRRNTALLAAAAPLLAFARGLPEYTTKTSALPEEAGQVRQALLRAREPERLLLADLPAAVGLEPFRGGSRSRTTDLALLQDRLTVALDDLRDAYAMMLDDCRQTLTAELSSGAATVADLRVELRGSAAVLSSRLLEPRLRSFVAFAAGDQLDDHAWLEAVLNNVGGRPPATWRDDDVARFELEARGLAGAYKRMLALHYDAAAAQRAGFDALRVTLTRPDGTEHSDVVWVDHGAKPQLQRIVDDAIAAAGRLDASSGPALLALLAGTVLDQHTKPDQPPLIAAAGRKERHA